MFYNFPGTLKRTPGKEGRESDAYPCSARAALRKLLISLGFRASSTVKQLHWGRTENNQLCCVHNYQLRIGVKFWRCWTSTPKSVGPTLLRIYLGFWKQNRSAWKFCRCKRRNVQLSLFLLPLDKSESLMTLGRMPADEWLLFLFMPYSFDSLWFIEY